MELGFQCTGITAADRDGMRSGGLKMPTLLWTPGTFSLASAFNCRNRFRISTPGQVPCVVAIMFSLMALTLPTALSTLCSKSNCSASNACSLGVATSRHLFHSPRTDPGGAALATKSEISKTNGEQTSYRLCAATQPGREPNSPAALNGCA